MIFSRFRTFTDKRGYELVEISQRVAFFELVRTDGFKSTDYVVQDGETPMSLAQDFYSNPELDWTILYMNKIVHPFYDWVMPTNIFQQYLVSKYGSISAYSEVMKYVAPDGREFPADPDAGLIPSGFTVGQCTAITFEDYESDLNEKKRRIRVIRPEAISQILEEYRKLMKSAA